MSIITFKITFLLGFEKISEVEKKPKKVKSPKGKKSPRGRSSTKKSKKSEKGSKKSKSSGKGSKKSKSSGKGSKISGKGSKKDEQEERKDAIAAKSPQKYIHIDYNLFPGKQKCAVDIILWGPIVTVYNGNESRSFKTIVKDNLIWAPIYVEHNSNALDTFDIKALRTHLVTFNLNFNKNKMGKKAQSDKTKAFYILESDEDKVNDIVEVYPTEPKPPPPEDSPEFLYEHMKNIVIECINRPRGQEVTSSIGRPFDNVHKYKVFETLKKLSQNKALKITSPCIRTIDEGKSKKAESTGSPPSPKSKTTKTRKSSPTSTKSTKSTKSGSLVYKFPGEVFITYPEFSLHQLPQPAAFQKGFIFISVTKLMTVETKFDLVPLIVKIIKINNLPVDELVEKGYQNVWVNCEIPGIFQFRTCDQDIRKTIKVNEARCIWAKTVPKLKLIELLQTQRVYTEIWGDKPIKGKKIQQSKGGAEKGAIDNKKSKSKLGSKKSGKGSIKSKGSKKSLQQIKKQTVPQLIALAAFDVTSLLQYVWIFKEESQCHHPTTLTIEKFDTHITRYVTDRITVNEANFDFNYKSPSSFPVSEATLATLNTTIKLEMYFLAPHYATLRVQHIEANYFRRLLLVVFNKHLANYLSNEILMHNQSIMGPAVLMSDYLDPLQTNQADLNTVTGFLVDNNDSSIFFIEGVHNGRILHLYHHIQDLDLEMAKVFFNSDFLFEKRLYPDFKFLGGFYVTMLKFPLQELFQKKEMSTRGSVPIPCWKAITKLNFLLQSETFKSILQLNLLPNSKELLSLGVEFGVPLTWKLQEEEQLQTFATGDLRTSTSFFD